MHILMTGGSGLIGSALQAALRANNHDITCVSRSNSEESDAWWDIENQRIHLPKNRPIHAAIHLAGENIAGGPWTAARKQRILNSRVQGTALLCKALASLEQKPTCLISASAVGFYGNQETRLLDESSPAGQGFLAHVCQSWEDAARPALDAGIRVAHTRLGVVLDRQGGMLSRMPLPFRLCLGGPLGSGQQVMSWVSIQDVTRSMDFILQHPELEGPINITSPNPVTNNVFTEALASVLHRPAPFRIPGFALEWMLADLARELLLSSQNAIPQRLLNAGFEFKHKDIKPTLEHLIRNTLGRSV